MYKREGEVGREPLVGQLSADMKPETSARKRAGGGESASEESSEVQGQGFGLLGPYLE